LREQLGVGDVRQIKSVRVERAPVLIQRRCRSKYNVRDVQQTRFPVAYRLSWHIRIRGVFVDAVIDHQLVIEPSDQTDERRQKQPQNRR
jgi:hypothetical protein